MTSYQGFEMFSRLRIYGELIKFEHTLFALPFAYMALLLTQKSIPPLNVWLLITLAMVGGRTAGMALNRIIDREIDARNPRTATRPIPKGLVSVGQAWALTAASLALLVWSAWRLNPICAWLSPIVVILLTLYPYMKRWSWLTHFVLGAVYFCIPPAVWLATVKVISWEAIFLGCAMGTWVTGFDILYTLQDMEIDRGQGLHSIPVRFGPALALRISAMLHLQTIVWLVGAGWLISLNWVYWVGVAGTAGLLIYEHQLLSPTDYSKLNQAFFTVNGFVSVWLFFIVLVSVTI